MALFCLLVAEVATQQSSAIFYTNTKLCKTVLSVCMCNEDCHLGLFDSCCTFCVIYLCAISRREWSEHWYPIPKIGFNSLCCKPWSQMILSSWLIQWSQKSSRQAHWRWSLLVVEAPDCMTGCWHFPKAAAGWHWGCFQTKFIFQKT